MRYRALVNIAHYCVFVNKKTRQNPPEIKNGDPSDVIDLDSCGAAKGRAPSLRECAVDQEESWRQ